jgi:hypothetical protein
MEFSGNYQNMTHYARAWSFDLVRLSRLKCRGESVMPEDSINEDREINNEDRKINLAFILQKIYPTVPAESVEKQIIKEMYEKCKNLPVVKTVQRYFSGGHVRESTAIKIIDAIISVSNGKINHDIMMSIDEKYEVFKDKYRNYFEKKFGKKKSFADICAGLSVVEQANRQWYNNGVVKIDVFIGVHHIYALTGRSGGLERHILTIISTSDGVRATLAHSGGGGKLAGFVDLNAVGIALESDTFITFIFIKQEKDEFHTTPCFILLSRKTSSEGYRVGVACKDGYGHLSAYRVIAKRGAEGDKPVILSSDDPMYGVLKEALSLGEGGPPAVIDADLRQIDALLNGQ